MKMQFKQECRWNEEAQVFVGMTSDGRKVRVSARAFSAAECEMGEEGVKDPDAWAWFTTQGSEEGVEVSNQ
jgi:hypothetical protein